MWFELWNSQWNGHLCKLRQVAVPLGSDICPHLGPRQVGPPGCTMTALYPHCSPQSGDPPPWHPASGFSLPRGSSTVSSRDQKRSLWAASQPGAWLCSRMGCGCVTKFTQLLRVRNISEISTHLSSSCYNPALKANCAFLKIVLPCLPKGTLWFRFLAGFWE